MSAREEVAAGYLLVHPIPRPADVGERLLPSEILSASHYVCRQFPDPTALAWVEASEKERFAALAEVGLATRRRREALAWATARFEIDFGWPGIFYTAAAATEARDRFFGSESKIKIIGLGLPAHYRDEFIDMTASAGEMGALQNVRRGEPLAPGARGLGFEPINVETGQLGESWLCAELETHCAKVLGIRPNDAGFLDSLEQAVRCCDEISREGVGTERGPWLPLRIAVYG
jgi:hypothetical protein